MCRPLIAVHATCGPFAAQGPHRIGSSSSNVRRFISSQCSLYSRSIEDQLRVQGILYTIQTRKSIDCRECKDDTSRQLLTYCSGYKFMYWPMSPMQTVLQAANSCGRREPAEHGGGGTTKTFAGPTLQRKLGVHDEPARIRRGYARVRAKTQLRSPQTEEQGLSATFR